MSVRVTPAEPAAGPVALAAGGGGARPARTGLRWAAWVLGSATILGAVLAGAPATGPGREPLLTAGARLLSRWRDGRIDIQGGTLRWPLTGAPLPVTLTVRHAQLRRLASAWSADALVLLPASLGASAHLALQVTGDPARPAGSSGTLSFEGRMLEFAGWRQLIEYPPLERYLPHAGRGNLELHTEFAQGRVLNADGKVRAQALEWTAPVAAAAALTVDRLSGSWRLERLGARWRLEVHALELGELSVDAAADAAWGRGRVESAPVSVGLAIARWYAPQLPLAQVALGGTVRELGFDWDARRPGGVRLRTSAQLADVTVATPSRDLVLTGVRGYAAGAGRAPGGRHQRHADPPPPAD